MSINERHSHKTGGNDGTAVEQDSERKIVALRTGQKIVVEDAVWSRDNSLLKLNIEGDGIDCTVPREHVELVVKTTAGEEVINHG